MARASTKQKPVKTGVSFVRELGGIREYRLDKNGLRILLAQDTSVPVAGVMVTYHVGSRNEAVGYTGSTHMLEHLLFERSENFEAYHQELEAKGAYINATTWYDRTNYFEVIPKNLLKQALAWEADRMRTAHITEKDRSEEMSIVRNEFERGENLPLEALDKQIWAAAFNAHPYHQPVIGWRSDIEGVSVDRLNQFYNEFYWPDNATVTVVGDFEEGEVLQYIAKEFGRHARNPNPYPALYTVEPKQEGERRTFVNRAGNNMVGIAHKIPHALHPDIPALLLLTNILDNGKTSRLYKELVDAALATDVSTFCVELHDPSLFLTYTSLTPKATHEKVEKVIKNEYEKLKSTNVPAGELARAKRLVRTQLAARRDGPYQFLSFINESIATGDWTHFLVSGDALMQVTAADIKRVANTYFVDDQATIGYFINTA